MQITSWRSLLDAIRGRPAPVPEPIADAPRVQLISSWRREDEGWDQAARLHAQAMRAGGVDVRLVSDGRCSPFMLTPETLAEVDGMVDSEGFEPDVSVLSYQLMDGPKTGAKLLEFRPDVMHGVFETISVDLQAARQLNRLRATWAQCKANAGALAVAGVERVAHLPMPWLPSDPLLKIPLSTRSDRFLWVGRAEFRKAPDVLVRAFATAFKPGEATLTLKLSRWKNPQPYPDPEDVVRELGRSADVRVIRGQLSRAEMLALYAEHDVYASASRGEGWDLAAFSAKLAGRRYAGTDSGGPRDFLGEGDLVVPRSGTIAGVEGPYASHDFDALVAVLQEARRAPGGSRPSEELRIDRVGQKHREFWGSLTKK